MARNEADRFVLLVIILLAVQCLDFARIPEVPFWYLYLFNATIDATVFFLVYFLIYKTHNITAFLILCLQSAELITHFYGWSLGFMYYLQANQVLQDWHDRYTDILTAILCLKMAVLGAGGFDIYRRKRRRYNSWDSNPGVLLSDDYSRKSDLQGHQRDKR